MPTIFSSEESSYCSWWQALIWWSFMSRALATLHIGASPSKRRYRPERPLSCRCLYGQQWSRLVAGSASQCTEMTLLFVWTVGPDTFWRVAHENLLTCY